MPCQARAQSLVIESTSVASGTGLARFGLLAATVAGRTSAEGIVEMKKARLGLQIKNVATRTEKTPIKELFSLIGEQRQPTVAPGEGGLDGVDQALRRAFPGFEAVDQHPDVFMRARRRQWAFSQAQHGGA